MEVGTSLAFTRTSSENGKLPLDSWYRDAACPSVRKLVMVTASQDRFRAWIVTAMRIELSTRTIALTMRTSTNDAARLPLLQSRIDLFDLNGAWTLAVWPRIKGVRAILLCVAAQIRVNKLRLMRVNTLVPCARDAKH
jgi:hypothetical protein